MTYVDIESIVGDALLGAPGSLTIEDAVAPLTATLLEYSETGEGQIQDVIEEAEWVISCVDCDEGLPRLVDLPYALRRARERLTAIS